MNRPKTTATQVNAVRSLLMAKANLEVMQERMAPIQAELLRVWKPVTKERTGRRPGGEPITEWKWLWLTDDATFADIMADKEALQAKAGISASKPGNCPLLEAEHLVTVAQHAVVLAFSDWGPIQGVTVNKLLCLGMDKYKQFIDLCCGLVASDPANHAALRKVA
jgi:hypothetical protein